MNAQTLNPTKTNRDELGEKLGELNSTSETVQVGIVLAGVSLSAVLWGFTSISPAIIFVGCPLTVAAAYWFALRSPYFRSSLQFFENGIELVSGGETNLFRYDSITVVTSRTQDYHHKGMYVGTKVEIDIQTENPHRFFKYQCDFQRGSKKQSVIHQMLDKCSEGVQAVLCEKLERDGELPWTAGVSLTMNGLKLSDTEFDTSRTVLFEEIEDVKLDNNLLKIWKKDDALPCAAIPSGISNFAPQFGLFCTMRNHFLKHDNVLAETVEAAEAIDVLKTPEANEAERPLVNS